MSIQAQKADQPDSEKSKWSKTKTPNLIRYNPSGVYYMRARIAGKLHVKSLETDVYETAKLRLPDKISPLRKAVNSIEQVRKGRMTFGDALQAYRAKVEADASLKPRSKEYREETIEFLTNNWKGIEELDIRKITEKQCREWSVPFAAKYSSTVYNNTLGTLRAVFAIAMEAGAIYTNPAEKIKKKKVRQKRLVLPSQEQFAALVKSVREAGSRFSRGCGDLIEFLAFGGMRKGEAARVTGADCNFDKGQITVHGDPEHGTKNWSVRTVPMIPEMRALLERIKARRTVDDWKAKPVMSVRECQKAIDSAVARMAGDGFTCPRITHHDLRHLFATRCIESGVDVPTVARWLGHKDGGALAMKTYGHLRDDHSADMAAKVSFGTNGGAK